MKKTQKNTVQKKPKSKQELNRINLEWSGNDVVAKECPNGSYLISYLSSNTGENDELSLAIAAMRKGNGIHAGEYFVCDKDVVMDTGEVAYKKGKMYKSENDGCITDEEGDKCHVWEKMNTKHNGYSTSDYFHKATIEELVEKFTAKKELETTKNDFYVSRERMYDCEKKEGTVEQYSFEIEVKNKEEMCKQLNHKIIAEQIISMSNLDFKLAKQLWLDTGKELEKMLRDEKKKRNRAASELRGFSIVK